MYIHTLFDECDDPTKFTCIPHILVAADCIKEALVSQIQLREKRREEGSSCGKGNATYYDSIACLCICNPFP